MKLDIKLLVFLLFVSITYSKERNDKKYKVVCYWGSWSFYRPANGKFSAEDTNPNICTHMMYGFTKLVNNKITVFDPDLDTGDTEWDSGEQWGEGMYRRFNHLRDVNPHMTTMISIGGWNEGSDKYSQMVGSSASRSTFVESVVQFLQKWEFDGLDVDWEYPSMKASGDQDRTPGNEADKENYILLLRELHEAFQPHGFVLSAAVSAGKPTIDRAYNVPEMMKYLDLVNLMTYDFHGGWESRTGHNAPLYPRPNDTEIDKEFTVEFAVDHWLKLGADPKKLILGMPLYGHTFILANPSNNGLYAPTTGKGAPPGPFTEEVGTLGYNEYCQDLKSGKWKVIQEETQKVPYAVNGNQWLGFDDEKSIKDKVDFLKSKGLGGGMVWSIDTDDFKGLCGNGKYPLLKTISRELNGIDGPDPIIHIYHPTPTPHTKATKKGKTTKHPLKPTTTSGEHTKVTHKGHTDVTTEGPTEGPTEATTHNSGGEFKCKAAGFFADPKDKTIFHECVNNGGNSFEDIVYHCGPGTIYDEVHHICKLP